MRKLLYAIFSISLVAFPLLVTAEVNEFDKVCNYFSQLQKSPKVDEMTHRQRNNFIIKKINSELSETSNARVAWEAVAFAVAEQRYELYKSSVESVLKKEWSCAAMQQLAHKTGEFE